MIPLPPAYAERMRLQLGSGAQAYFEALEQPYVRGIRIHPLKTPNEPVKSLVEGIAECVPWAGDAHYLDIDDGQLENHDPRGLRTRRPAGRHFSFSII